MRLIARVGAVLLASAVCAPLAREACAQTITETNVANARPMTPGTTVTRTPNTNEAWIHRWRIDGVANDSVFVSFTLPGTATNGATTIPLTFSATSAGWTYNSTNCCTAQWNPTVERGILLNAAGQAYIYLGFSANATGGQPAGTYTATTTISVRY